MLSDFTQFVPRTQGWFAVALHKANVSPITASLAQSC